MTPENKAHLFLGAFIGAWALMTFIWFMDNVTPRLMGVKMPPGMCP